MPCVISAFEKRSDTIVADQDISFLFKGLGILFAFYCSLFRPSYPLCMMPAPLQARHFLGSPRRRISRECHIDTKQAAGECARDPRGARPRIRTDSHKRRLAHLSDFPLRSVKLPGPASAKSPNPATRDTTTVHGAPVARSGAHAMGGVVLRSRAHAAARTGTRRDGSSVAEGVRARRWDHQGSRHKGAH